MIAAGLEKTWASEADDAVRGLAGGFLIGVPVVFTVDSWWLGDQLTPANALALIVFAYLLTLAVVFWSGFRTGARASWSRFGDALEAMALAIFTLFLIFGSLGQIFDGQPLSSTVGRVAVALAPLSIGIAVANHLVPRGASRLGSDVDREADAAIKTSGSNWQRTAHELGAAAAGALFICMAIVPGDELTDIVTEVPLRNLPYVIVLSLLFSYVVVFAAGFKGQRRRRIDPGPLQHPVAETVSGYVVALVISWFALGFFGHVGFHTPGLVVFMKCVLLAFPASVGAAAGSPHEEQSRVDAFHGRAGHARRQFPCRCCPDRDCSHRGGSLRRQRASGTRRHIRYRAHHDSGRYLLCPAHRLESRF